MTDLQQIAAAMKAKGGYEVNDQAGGGFGLVISRAFDGVKYNIIMEKRGNNYELNLSTNNFAGYPSGSVEGGERCTTPAYQVEKRTNQIFQDMPLNSAQRAELKENVRVINVGSVKVTF